MKKQNNIIKYIAKAAYAMVFVASLQACIDDNIVSGSYIEEGIPVKINMQYAKPEMTNIATRGLGSNEEKKVNDLYLLIFNEAGTTRKEGSGLFEGDKLNGEKITLSTTSGNSLIYGIANVINNQQENLKAKLDAINSVEDLKKCFISAIFEGDFIDVDRTTPNLVMSGPYSQKNPTSDVAGFCPITTDPIQKLDGTIKLVHLDSHITFRIHTGEKVKTFEPNEWQVCKVPKQSYLIAQSNTNSGGTEPTHYANSRVYNNQNFLTEEDSFDKLKKMYTFQFYQFENFKPAIGGEFTAQMREEEVKDGNLNTGKFLHVDSCATYVQFKANMELTEEGVEQRMANVTIKILLGGKDKDGETYDPRNFNTWRNTKYIYEVTINDVDDIVTEVNIPGREDRPGLEGDVMDVINEAPVLDAHFNCFNILLDPADFQGDDLSIVVHTPFDDIIYNKSNSTRPTENRDYKWVKFKFLHENNYLFNNIINSFQYMPLASYKNEGNANLVDIYDLKADVLKRWGPSYYTVFIDEYYYEAPPRNNLGWKEPLWTNFVNKNDRYVILSTPKKSDDQESSYSKAKYVIRQKSIQTYYSTITSEGAALGMEHVNETRVEERSWKGTLNYPENGYFNCDNYISSKGKSWSKHAYPHPYFSESGYSTPYPTKTYDKYTFTLQNDDSNAACLNRNRDKNGDGTIDDGEMDWYLPTFNQISGMYLGATSIPSPLFSYSPSMDGVIAFDDGNYHFMTSDNDKIWGQEGCSNNGTGTYPKAGQIRCVRNLGIKGVDSKNTVPPRPYKATPIADGHYVFDMSGIEPSNLRASKVTDVLGFHDNFSDSRNKPYKKFELAKNFMEDTALPGKTYTWELYYGKEDRCKQYSEGTGERGTGKWRTPNQRELLIMYNTIGVDEMIHTINGTKYGMYSCTYWKLDHWYETSPLNRDGYRIFGIHTDNRKMFLDNNPSPEEGRIGHISECGTILRCVRDID